MRYRRIHRIHFSALLGAVLGLSISTANALAQTAADEEQAVPDDSPDLVEAGQSDDRATTDGERGLPTLDQMLRVAMQHNPDVRAARAEVAVAEANLDRTRLTVVKVLTAYRDRWLSLKASLTQAATELADAERLAAKGFILEVVLVAGREKVGALQLQLRELETELPFLLGAPLEAGNERAASAVERRTDILKDKAIPLAEQVLALSLESYQSGTGELGGCVTWSSRLMQLQRDVAESEEGRRAAAEAHLKRLEDIKRMADAAYKAGVGMLEDVLAVEFAIIEAQTMLGGHGAE